MKFHRVGTSLTKIVGSETVFFNFDINHASYHHSDIFILRFPLVYRFVGIQLIYIFYLLHSLVYSMAGHCCESCSILASLYVSSCTALLHSLMNEGH